MKLVKEVRSVCKAVGSFKLNEITDSHEFKSVIVRSYDPTDNEDKSSEDSPLDQLKIYGGTEPVVV